jgi:hypothetical protein
MAGVDFQRVLQSPSQTYQEGLDFFTGQGIINNVLQRLALALEKLGIDYNIVGALALNQHGYKRFTEDIDLLLTKEGLEKFHAESIKVGCRPKFEGAKKQFCTTTENVTVEIITTGDYPGDGLPKAVSFPDPQASYEVIDGLKTISLEKLIELKLASGLTAPHRLKDLADVQEVIKLKGLTADFATRLDASVREKFLELQQAVAQAQTDSVD